MSTALTSAIAVVSAAGVSGAFAWLSHRGNARVEQVAAVLDAYNEIVKNLQTELARVQTELVTVREEMRDCERRAAELKGEMEQMRVEMAVLETALLKTSPVRPTPRKRAVKG